MQLFHFSNLSKFKEINHFVSTREGGVSKPPFNSLNLGFHTADHHANVVSNWKILSEVSNIDLNSFIIAHQVHKGNVFVADQKSIRGAWNNPANEIDNTDAFIVVTRNICIVVKVADCVPILVYDPVLHIAAAIHAGWKGVINSVTSNTIEILINTFKSKPENLIVGIGPSIGACCYEVGAVVEQAVMDKWGFTDKFLVKSKSGSGYTFDLWYANQFELIGMGIKPENIETAGICTHCNSDKYFSARHNNGVTGRFCAGIMLK